MRAAIQGNQERKREKRKIQAQSDSLAREIEPTKIQQDERRTSQEFRMTSNLGYRAEAWVSQDIEGWRSRRWDGLGEDDPLEIIGALDGIHLLLVEAVRRLLNNPQRQQSE